MLRRLMREARIRKEFRDAFARFAEAAGRPGMDLVAFYALPLAERLKLLESFPAAGMAFAEAYERWRAFEDERRHHDKRGAAEARPGNT